MRYLRLGTLVAAGVLLLIAGLVYSVVFAGIPYQDPTPQMYATWKSYQRIGDSLMISGLVVLASGGLWVLVRWIARPRR